MPDTNESIKPYRKRIPLDRDDTCSKKSGTWYFSTDGVTIHCVMCGRVHRLTVDAFRISDTGDVYPEFVCAKTDCKIQGPLYLKGYKRPRATPKNK